MVPTKKRYLQSYANCQDEIEIFVVRPNESGEINRSVEGEVPSEFVSNYALLDFFQLDPENEQIQKHIGYIASVYTEGDSLVVETGIKLGLEE